MKFSLVLISLLATSVLAHAGAAPRELQEEVMQVTATFECQSPDKSEARAVLYTAKDLTTYKIETKNTPYKFVLRGRILALLNTTDNGVVMVGLLDHHPTCSSENRGNILRPVPVVVDVNNQVTFRMSPASLCQQVSASQFTKLHNMSFEVDTLYGRKDVVSWQATSEYFSAEECELQP